MRNQKEVYVSKWNKHIECFYNNKSYLIYTIYYEMRGNNEFK